ncbi:MAG: hypothetical protein ACREEK_13165, partial [Bradyrhizobium sp.]
MKRNKYLAACCARHVGLCFVVGFASPVLPAWAATEDVGNMSAEALDAATNSNDADAQESVSSERPTT